MSKPAHFVCANSEKSFAGTAGMPSFLLTMSVTTSIDGSSMKTVVQAELKPKPGSCPEEVAHLEMLRTMEALSHRFAQVLKTENLSSTQYNVLRILRGAPEGLPCGEIGNRLVTRDSDITRLLDRLEKRALISRCRESKDRRTVWTRITPEGLELLARLDKPVRAAHLERLGHLGTKRLNLLADLLRLARQSTP
jgi:DNA-binding MarR family transcriptional regulator